MIENKDKNGLDYYKVRNKAWLFLIENNVRSYPLNLQEIADKNNWQIWSYAQYCQFSHRREEDLIASHPDGFTIQNGDRFFICYNQNNYKWRNRFTIAHEFGHIVLHKDITDSKMLEKEANMFASRILMPMVLIKELNISTPETLSKLCDVSIEASTFRMKRYKKIKTRHKFYTNKYEIKLLKQLRDFIKSCNKI